MPKPAAESTPKETPKPASKATPKSAPKSAAKSAAKETPKPASKETPKSVTKEADETPAPKPKAKQEKTPKKTPAKATPAKATPAKSAKKSAKKADPNQIVEEKEKVVQEVENNAKNAATEEEQASSDEEVDEQTKALVLAVDSGDEDEQASGVITFEEGQDVGTIPDVSKVLSKKEKKEKKALKAAPKDKEETGVIYIGRLPHGFYEHEMKNYFSQFGPIRNLRVSRNKKTGRAKHFAFVEFQEASTAEIVAKTMDVSRALQSFRWR
jgi:nucleolar protein 15